MSNFITIRKSAVIDVINDNIGVTDIGFFTDTKEKYEFVQQTLLDNGGTWNVGDWMDWRGGEVEEMFIYLRSASMKMTCGSRVDRNAPIYTFSESKGVDAYDYAMSIL